MFPDSSGGGSFGRMLDKGASGSTTGWRASMSSSGTDSNFNFRYNFSDTDGGWDVTNGIAFGEWQHWVITYDADSVANNPLLYKNGSSQTVTETTTPVGTRSSDASDPFQIGNRGAQNRGFDGEICHVQVWSRIITAGEAVECMYKPGSVASGLVAYWNLFGVNSPEIDYSVNSNSGTVTGTTASFDGPPINKSG